MRKKKERKKKQRLSMGICTKEARQEAKAYYVLSRGQRESGQERMTAKRVVDSSEANTLAVSLWS
jgi:hypothetical protein